MRLWTRIYGITVVKSKKLYVNNKSLCHKWELNVETCTQGYRYRFRIIGAGASRAGMKVSIDGHKLILISSDGRDFEPMVVDAFVMYPGER